MSNDDLKPDWLKAQFFIVESHLNKQDRRFDEVCRLIDQLNRQPKQEYTRSFKAVNRRLDTLKERTISHEGRTLNIEHRMTTITRRLDGIDARVTDLNAKIDNLINQLDTLLKANR